MTTNSADDSFTDYLLSEIRCAIVRTKLWQNDLTAIGLALKAGLIDPDNAVEHLADCGVLRLITPSSSTTTISFGST